MSALLSRSADRRAFTAAVASLPIAKLASLFKREPTAPAPSSLIDMLDEWRVAEAELDRAAGVECDAEEAAKARYPDMPREMRWTTLTPGSYEIHPTSPGRGLVYVNTSDDNMNALRRLAAGEKDDEYEGGFEDRVRRARQIVEAYDAWMAERQRIEDEEGWTAAKVATEAALHATSSARERIIAQTAANFGELAIQARFANDSAIQEYDGGDEFIESLLDRLVQLAQQPELA